MLYLQILVNGLLLGGLYACIASGFSLVWGVLNVINILHGSFIVIGSYIGLLAHQQFGINPFITVPIAGMVLYGFGYALQRGVINFAVGQPVLVTLTLTFGLELLVNNSLILGFTADYKKVDLENPLGQIQIGDLFIAVDRLLAMVLALVLTGILYWMLRGSKLGRAIVAVRMDREAAALMGVKVSNIYAVTFGLGALMAGAAGSMMSMIYPISPLSATGYLGKAFVICVLGGLGSVPGAIVGGLALGVIESFGSLFFSAELATTFSFVLLIILLIFRPTGLMGRRGYE